MQDCEIAISVLAILVDNFEDNICLEGLLQHKFIFELWFWKLKCSSASVGVLLQHIMFHLKNKENLDDILNFIVERDEEVRFLMDVCPFFFPKFFFQPFFLKDLLKQPEKKKRGRKYTF